MIKFLCSITLFASFCSPQNLGALSILKPSQGGTGIGTAVAGDVGKCLKVLDDSPFAFEIGDCSAAVADGSFSTTSADYWQTQRNFFSTTSADSWKTERNFYSTTSADYWITQTSIEALSDVSSMTENFGDLLHWNGSSWSDIATSSLGLQAFSTTSADNWLTTKTTANLTEGANLYFTDERAQDALNIFVDSGTIDFTYNDGTPSYTGIVIADSIGDTQLAFNTGQNLTTASAPTFADLTVTNKVTAGYASTTGFSSSYASSSAAHFGTLNLKNLGDGLLELSSGVVQLATAGTDYVAPATTITVNGTTDQITSSAGAQDLSANRTWTLSLPDIVRFPQSFTASYGTTTYASTTAITASYASSSVGRFGQLFASNQSDGCAQYSSGQITSTGSACGSGGGAWPFNTETHGGTTTQSTTSPLWLKFGLHASSTSAFDDILAARATTTSATTTNLHVSGQLDIGSQTGLTLTTSGVVSAYAGASCTNQFPRSQDASGAWTCATVANTDLANSTISGIALGSTLANLTATDSTLTFSGAYNGGTARTVGLNLANPNSWTALQQFTNATSTLFSATYASTTNFLSFYASSTLATTSSATTTNFAIGSLSATRIPFATTSGSILSDSAFTWENTVKRLSFTYASATSISVSGTASTTNLFVSGLGSASTQCAQIAANGQITGTGSACGGSGSGSTAWATSSPYSGQIIQYPSDTNADILFGASATSTAPFWWDVSASTAYFGVSAANDSRLTFNPDGSATSSIGIDYSNSGAFSISMSGTLGTNEVFTAFTNGRIGFGSSSPFANFSFATSATDFSRPLFQIATTSGPGNRIWTAIATTTKQSLVSTIVSNVVAEVTARIGVLTSSYAGFGGLLDHFTVNGRLNTEGFNHGFCDAPTGINGLTGDAATDGQMACGPFSFAEDGTATLTAQTTTNGGYVFGRIDTTAAGDGTGVWLSAPSGGGLIAATSTPVLEVTARIASPLNATSSNYFIGFSNVATGGTAIDTLPTGGCFFTASSTEANWRAVCRTALNTGSYQDTGVASTSSVTTTGAFRKFRVELDSTTARFYIQQPSGNLVKTNEITHSLTTQQLNAGVHIARPGSGAGLTAGLDFFRLRVWWRDFVPSL